MPFPPLYQRLQQKTKGRLLDAEQGLAVEKPAALSAEEWSRFTSRTDPQPGWIDYTIEW